MIGAPTPPAPVPANADGSGTGPARGPMRRRAGRIAVVLLGIAACQFVLFGPSLLGRRVLLPLDILKLPGVYLPVPLHGPPPQIHDLVCADLVYQFEAERRFVASEMAAGRFAMWLPYQYGGVPLVWPRFSPFLMVSCLTPSPRILAWVQLLEACVAGFGAYAFCRRVLRVGFLPAASAAWCYPLTGFFVFWTGYPTCGAVYWLPWLLLAVEGVVRRPGIGATAWLAVASCAVLISGHIDVAGQALIVSGLFALWRLGRRRRPREPASRAVVLLAAGWMLGFLLAGPHLLPLLDYASEGVRMMSRGSGFEERPPGALTALPQMVLPDLYGSSRSGSFRYVKGNQIESSAAAYAGLIAALLAAPLAWCRRRQRSVTVFFTVLAVLGAGWCLGLPGWVSFLRLPGLNLMSHNRLVFATAFAIVALSALGLDALQRGLVSRRRWFVYPILLCGGLLVWCAYRGIVPPAAIAARVPDNAPQVESWFRLMFARGAVLSGIALAGWLTLVNARINRTRVTAALGALMVVDLVVFAWDRSAQCDPALDFPPIPALQALARDAPGRVISVGCLQPTMSELAGGLWDVRGYDSVDPARMVQLLELACMHDKITAPYSVTQFMYPRLRFETPDAVRLSPILDMLGVRHVVFWGEPPVGIRPVFASPDYWVMINRSALPRLFVPARVGVEADGRALLRKLASPNFDPRAIAWVEEPVAVSAVCRGRARIVDEIPTRIRARLTMETPGLVVLADRWDKGWRAYLDGRPVPILRTNHALRGVMVPAGDSDLEFRYEPAAFRIGLALCGAAAVGLALVAVIRARRWRRPARLPAGGTGG